MKKLGVVVLTLLALVGCSSQPKQAATNKLVIGVMPSLDSVPILWAESQGMFEEAGLDVELIVYTNGNDRDTQVQTKAVDAVVTDIMGLVAMREAGYPVQAVSETQTMFSVVAQKGAMDKESLKVGMAEISVTQYVADYGLKDYTVQKEFIDALPQRLEMVSQGQLDGAVIPEPMASMATLKDLDAVPIETASPNVLMFQSDSLLNKADEIRLFYDVYNASVDTLTKDTEALKHVVVSKLGLDEAILPVIKFPSYTHAKTVDEGVYDNVVKWMDTTLKMKTEVLYEDAVATGFFQ